MYYNQDVTISNPRNTVWGGGDTMEKIFLLFIIPIMTNVISYYICKLLDRYFKWWWASGYLRYQI